MKVSFAALIAFLAIMFTSGAFVTGYGMVVLFKHSVWLGLSAIIPAGLWLVIYGSFVLSILVSYLDHKR